MPNSTVLDQTGWTDRVIVTVYVEGYGLLREYVPMRSLTFYDQAKRVIVPIYDGRRNTEQHLMVASCHLHVGSELVLHTTLIPSYN